MNKIQKMFPLFFLIYCIFILLFNISCTHDKIGVSISSNSRVDIIKKYASNIADYGSKIVVVTYSSNYDSLSALHYNKALMEPYCSMSTLGVVVLLRDTLLWNQLSNSQLNSNVKYSLMTSEEQEILCKECGFTAIVNLINDNSDYAGYYVDPYAVCDHVNNSIMKGQVND